MKRFALAIVAGVVLALASPVSQSASAQQRDFANAQIRAQDLGHGVYELVGPGGNITIATGDDGIIMVDAEFAPLHDKIKTAIDAISKQPIKYIINTHFHPDHTDGDAAFLKEGVTVIAQENVVKRLLAGTTNGLTGNHTAGLPPDAVPNKTYRSGTLTLKVKGVTAVVGHIANAHTDGDSYVWFPEANVLATGDVVVLGRFPNIDFANGGSIDGMIAGVDRFLTLVNDKTWIVPGHGALMRKRELVKYRQWLVDARNRITLAIKRGMTEDQTIAAAPFADTDFDAKAQATWVQMIYRSLKLKKAS